jgi:hypothetical protein
MTSRKTHRRKRVTHRRRSHKRVTHRRKRSRGGYPRTVAEIRAAYEAIKGKTKTMTLNNYEEIHSEIRALHDEAKNAGNSKLAQQIEGYEYGVVNQEIKKLHAKGGDENTNENTNEIKVEEVMVESPNEIVIENNESINSNETS